MLTARHFALSAAVVMLLAGAGYARGAPASEGFALSAIQINPKNPNIVYASSALSDTTSAASSRARMVGRRGKPRTRG